MRRRWPWPAGDRTSPECPRPTLIAFFVRDPGWRKPDEYLASINSQLLEALGRRGGTPGDLLSLRAQFSELWTDAVAAASAEAPLLLIVDALDEMARGETTIADLLPSILTEHAGVIVSSRPRPNPRDLVQERHPLRSAPVLRLTTFDQRAVTALLRGMAVPAELAQRVALRIHSLTRGEPLFAHAVAEDVAAHGEGALETLEQEPPAGAREYFLSQLKAIDQAAADDSTWRTAKCWPRPKARFLSMRSQACWTSRIGQYAKRLHRSSALSLAKIAFNCFIACSTNSCRMRSAITIWRGSRRALSPGARAHRGSAGRTAPHIMRSPITRSTLPMPRTTRSCRP